MSLAKSTFPVTMRDRLAQVAYPPKPPGIALTIDNGDGNGPRDYTGAIDRESKLRLHRALNGPSQMEFSLRLREPAMVVPAAGAKVWMTRADGTLLFSGSTESEPSYEFLGWGESGPVYRLGVRASSDDRALDERAVPLARLFQDVSAGSAAKQMAADVAGTEIDCAGVAELDQLYDFEVERRRPWSEQVADLAARARAVYRVEDGKLWLEAIGVRSHLISENAANFVPDALTVRSAPPRAGDITVVGDTEPAAYVKDYFVGDATRTTFALSQRPLTRPQRALLEDDFAFLDPLKWQIADPANALACGGGQLAISGGTAVAGETTMVAIGRLQLGGTLILQHGTLTFTGDSSGILGGLYPGAIAQTECLAGFLVSTSAGQVSISALIEGAAAGNPFAVVGGHSYALRTRIYCAEHVRARQVWHSSAHPAGEPAGGETVAAQLRIVLDIGDTDLAQPATAPSWTILYEQLLEEAPAFAAYGLVNAASMHAQLALTRIWRGPEVGLDLAPAGELPHTALLGRLNDGGAAVLAPGAVLQFFEQTTPALQEQITVRYRASRTAAARVALNGPAAARALVCRVAAPRPATSRDCALAAEALLDDAAQPRCAGEYSAWREASDSDIRPGDAVQLDVPSRGLDLNAVIREVWLEPEDIGAARWLVRFRFANEGAEPLAIRTAAASRDPEPLTAMEAGSPAATIGGLAAAEVTSFGAGLIAVDAGQEPPQDGGFEVRSSDSGWDTEGASLITRAATREFVLDRTSRPADYYLRAFDGAVPPRYSDVSTILHVDYPL